MRRIFRGGYLLKFTGESCLHRGYCQEGAYLYICMNELPVASNLITVRFNSVVISSHSTYATDMIGFSLNQVLAQRSRPKNNWRMDTDQNTPLQRRCLTAGGQTQSWGSVGCYNRHEGSPRIEPTSLTRIINKRLSQNGRERREMSATGDQPCARACVFQSGISMHIF